MLKLIIADDEKVIREAISTIIDWNAYDIELIRLCKNGLEAYNTILDESPDIVLTDIRMPHMDGLQLIKNVSEMELDIQFIILSGYGEFEYAKAAMQYGVKHYLLKPCNEHQIVECIQKTAHDCYQKKLNSRMGKNQFLITNNMQHSVISSIINDTISCKNICLEDTIKNYEPYMDFYYTPYTLFYIYFLEEEEKEEFLSHLEQYCRKKFPHHTIHGVYVHNTMLLFFKDYAQNYDAFVRFLLQMPLSFHHVGLEIETVGYSNLKDLLHVILDKIRRFSIICYINNFRAFVTCNYTYFTEESERCYQAFMETENPDEIKHLLGLFTGIGDLNFCRQLAVSLLLKISADNPALSAIDFTDWLISLNREENLTQLKIIINDKIKQALLSKHVTSKVSTMTKQIMNYVDEHLQDQNLTLKSIAEHELYMNVNYVSRKFFKDTGVKFSHYLSDVRIRKAKEYLASNEIDKIQDIAQLVGYGNNPQYFSHLFKKMAGMTPTAYNRSLYQTAGPDPSCAPDVPSDI